MKHSKISNLSLFFASSLTSLISHGVLLFNSERLNFGGGDFFHSVWTYKRNWRYLISLDPNYLDQIQYPSKGSAFLAELQIGNTIIFKLINGVLGNESATYSWMLLISGFLVFLSTFKILRFLGAYDYISVVIATYATSAMFLQQHTIHLQVVSFFWLLVPIWQVLELSKPSANFVVLRKTILFVTVLFLFAGPSYLNIVFMLVLGISIFLSLFISICKSDRFKDDLKLKLATVYGFLRPSIKMIIAGLLCSIVFWLPYIFWALRNSQVREVAEISLYRVDLSQIFNSSPNNWLYGQHNFSTQVGSVDSVFPGLTVFGLMILFFIHSRKNISNLQVYLLVGGSFLLLLSFASPITIFGFAVAPNPIYLFSAKVGLLSATRYLPTLAFFGSLLLFAGLAVGLKKVDFFNSKKSKVASILVCSMILLENFPSPVGILPEKPRLTSDWKVLSTSLENSRDKFVGIYPGVMMPFNPSGDPLFFRQFDWMAGLAEVPAKFIGGNTGFFTPASLKFMDKIQKRESLNDIPLKFCLVKRDCLLIVDLDGLSLYELEWQFDFILRKASDYGLPFKRVKNFLLIG